jgi:hypothetical protein
MKWSRPSLIRVGHSQPDLRLISESEQVYELPTQQTDLDWVANYPDWGFSELSSVWFLKVCDSLRPHAGRDLLPEGYPGTHFC